MDNPFVFGEAVSGQAFWNRTEEVKELLQDLRGGQNIILFSARRHGKTSLVRTVLHRLAGEGFITVYVDLYPATSKESFVRLYAKAVGEALGKPSLKLLSSVRRLLPRFLPKLEVDSHGKVGLSFDFTNPRVSKEGLRDLLHVIHQRALREKRRAVVVFDEFQEIASYGDDEIEREMRTAFQSHRNVAYVFLGSKKHLFQGIFNDVNRPFYRSGKHFTLGRLPEPEIVKYAGGRFAKGGIAVAPEVAAHISKMSMGHPYYTQLLCHILWSRCLSKKSVTTQDVSTSLETLLTRESASYQAVMDALSLPMRKLAIALSQDQTTTPYSKDFLENHRLGPASTVQRALAALLQKDVIDHVDGKYILQDPFLGLWLRRFS